ncbi:MAG: diaminopimelate epimerase [Anaerovoracaceae bacterium]|jgi:diaminopimelate epimerase
MKFTKMHGAGNDFIIINNMEEKIPVQELGALAKTLCNRRLSIGADGFMAVDYPDAGGDFKMRYYNADGSMGEMCGNGARCIARYGWEKKLAGERQKIETASGMVYGWRESERLYKIRLNDVTKIKQNCSADVLGREYKYSYVELGNPGLPHAVLRMEGLGSVKPKDFRELRGLRELKELGRTLRYHGVFSKGANINFYEVTAENQVRLLTFERGVEDFTLACGTGAGATVAALTMSGQVNGDNTKVCVPGGELFVTALREDALIKALYLTGPTCLVAEGEIIEICTNFTAIVTVTFANMIHCTQ